MPIKEDGTFENMDDRILHVPSGSVVRIILNLKQYKYKPLLIMRRGHKGPSKLNKVERILKRELYSFGDPLLPFPYDP